MNASPGVARHRLPGVLADPRVRVGLLAAAAIAVEAVVARSVLDRQLSFFAQFVALWIFAAYRMSGRRGRTSEIVTSVAVVAATVAVLVVYAV